MAEHVCCLLATLQSYPVPRAEPVTFEIIREIYADMLIELKWNELPWQTVAKHFTLATTGGKKKYAYFWRKGKKRRLRIYPIPAALQASVPEPTPQATPDAASDMREAA